MSMKQQSVKVFLRIRPLPLPSESKHSSPPSLKPILQIDKKQKQVTLRKPFSESHQSKLFLFDEIIPPFETQTQVFQTTTNNLITKIIEGYNGTIFTYGQTGSGKTYTMMGNIKSEEEMGIIPRSFKRMLELMEGKEQKNKNFLMRCSFIEIYNEDIYDLLISGGGVGNGKTRLEIRESYESGIFIKDLTKHVVKNIQEMLKLLNYGLNNRSVAETIMNHESSRSHAIFTIYLESSEKIQGEEQERFKGSKFNLVDLAGSERQSKSGSQGERLKQASKINLSLSALGNVISALVSSGKNIHVPYRDSKLTRLLQDSLGGNTKTIMIANVSSCSGNYEETLSTLRYASRAKYIQNVPVINEDPKDALLREYENQIKKLRLLLQNHNKMKTKMPTPRQLSHQNIPNSSTFSTKPSDQNKPLPLQDKQKQSLISKIKQLQQQLIHPSTLNFNFHEKLKQERHKRIQEFQIMTNNYQQLESEVEEMRVLLKDMRRKYKVAAKEIFELEKEHEEEKEYLTNRFHQLNRENMVNKAVIGTLFTEKQFQHLITLGSWAREGDGESFRLPPFYFKDKNTLAFPYESKGENGNDTDFQKTNGFRKSGGVPMKRRN